MAFRVALTTVMLISSCSLAFPTGTFPKDYQDEDNLTDKDRPAEWCALEDDSGLVNNNGGGRSKVKARAKRGFPETLWSGWRKSELIYQHVDLMPSANLTHIQQVTLTRKAFNEWSKYIPLEFKEADENDIADIYILASYIDGQHGTAARAWYGDLYPSGPKEQRVIKIYIDKDESWSAECDDFFSCTPYYTVMLHEIGHAIGLSHSHKDSAVMYYHLGRQTELSQWDIQYARTVYGLTLTRGEWMNFLLWFRNLGTNPMAFPSAAYLHLYMQNLLSPGLDSSALLPVEVDGDDIW